MPPRQILALVDCNSFYASCEKAFAPSLANRPVVVLSNNDGCVIARCARAKAAGIPMGKPAFTNSAATSTPPQIGVASNRKYLSRPTSLSSTVEPTAQQPRTMSHAWTARA